MEIHLRIIGVLLIIVALIHVVFPRYFKWKANLQSLSTINRQMMKVHTFFIALMVLLMGILCCTSSAALIGTDLGSRICLGLGIFWTLRLIIQFFGYSPTLWRGKIFETTMHILFTLLWLYVSSVFLLCFYFHNN